MQAKHPNRGDTVAFFPLDLLSYTSALAMSSVGPELVSLGFVALPFITLLKTPGLFLGLSRKKIFQSLSGSVNICSLVFPSAHIGRRTAEEKSCSGNIGAQIWKVFLG